MKRDMTLRIPVPPAGSGRFVVIEGLDQVTESDWTFVMNVLHVMKPGLIREPVSLVKKSDD